MIMQSARLRRLVRASFAAVMLFGAGVIAAAEEPARPSAPGTPAARSHLVIQAEAVDAEGKTLSDVEVLVALEYWQRSGMPRQVAERTRTNQAGRIRMEVSRERAGEKLSGAIVWAYRPGRAVAVSEIAIANRTPRPSLRLTLVEPAGRTVKVVDPDGQPIAGIRVAPRTLMEARDPTPLVVPEPWVDRLTGTTNAEGLAAIPDLPLSPPLTRVVVSGPGIAPHTFSLTAAQVNGTLRLGRPGRLVGVVRTESGQPIAGASIKVWLGDSRIPRMNAAGRAGVGFSPVETIGLESRPMESGPQGAFQTPPVLLTSSTYRVVVRKDGFAPFVSDWVTLGGERTVIPPIRLPALRTVTGDVRDRQGHPVAAARVFLPGGRSSTTTDAQGHFELKKVLPGKAVVLVEKPGFRLQGWPVDPSAAGAPRTFIPKRTTEAPDWEIRPLADSIPPEESRALANRLIEPLLHDMLEKGEDLTKRSVLMILSHVAPDRAVELLPRVEWKGSISPNELRAEMAAEMVEVDRSRAEALLDAVPLASLQLADVVSMMETVPVTLGARKRALLERAVVLFQGLPAAQRSRFRGWMLAEGWLDLGDVERARPLLLEGRERFDAQRPFNPLLYAPFLAQLARIEPAEAEARFRKMADAIASDAKLPEARAQTAIVRLDLFLAQAAVAIAIDHPAEAERLFDLRETQGAEQSSHTNTMQLCRRMAKVDPPRASRIAGSCDGAGERACACAFVALGLAEQDRRAAGEALDLAIEQIDRLRESGPEPIESPTGLPFLYPTNPAAAILLVVERVAPERLPEFFWRAVALSSGFDPEREESPEHSPIAYECLLLARYDRETTAALFEPMEVHLRELVTRGRGGDRLTPGAILAKGCLDPRAAVALVEALAPASPLRSWDWVNESRLALASMLAQPADRRARYVSRLLRVTMPLDD